MNTDFCPSVVLADAFGRRDLALGVSLILRRATLDRVGGFRAVVEYLADDHRLGQIVTAIGGRIALAPCVVESDPNPTTLGDALRHQLRWARTIRACAPPGYLASIVTHGMTFAACALLAAPLLPAGMAWLAVGVCMLRVTAAGVASWGLGAHVDATIALVPLRDLAATAVWCVSFAGNAVEWRGRRYRIDADGLLRDAEPACRSHPTPTTSRKSDERPEQAA